MKVTGNYSVQAEALAAEGLHSVSVGAKQTSTGCLAPYEHDLGVQNPIGEADFHGFCIRNWSGTEQLR